MQKQTLQSNNFFYSHDFLVSEKEFCDHYVIITRDIKISNNHLFSCWFTYKSIDTLVIEDESGAKRIDTTDVVLFQSLWSLYKIHCNLKKERNKDYNSKNKYVDIYNEIL